MGGCCAIAVPRDGTAKQIDKSQDQHNDSPPSKNLAPERAAAVISRAEQPPATSQKISAVPSESAPYEDAHQQSGVPPPATPSQGQHFTPAEALDLQQQPVLASSSPPPVVKEQDITVKLISRAPVKQLSTTEERRGAALLGALTSGISVAGAQGLPHDVLHLGPPRPPNFLNREQTVNALGLDSINSVPELTDLLAVVARVFSVKLSSLTLYAGNRSWIAAAKNFPLGPMPWCVSPCHWGFLCPSPTTLVCENLAEDARFEHQPFTKDGWRTYVSAPMVASNGHRLGAVCFLDNVVHKIDAGQCRLLNNFAELAVREVERFVDLTGKLEEDKAVQQAYPQDTPGPCRDPASAHHACVVMLDTAVPGWEILYTSQSWEQWAGVPREECIGRALFEVVESALDGASVRRGEFLHSARANARFVIPKVRVCSSGSAATTSNASRMFDLSFRPASLDALDNDTLPVDIPTMVPMTSSLEHIYVARLHAVNTCAHLAVLANTSKMSAAQACPTKSASALISGLKLGPVVGRGGYGTVYHAHWHDAEVVVKVQDYLLKSQQDRNEAELEISLGQDLGHPNVVHMLAHASCELERECRVAVAALPRTFFIDDYAEWTSYNTVASGCFNAAPLPDKGCSPTTGSSGQDVTSSRYPATPFFAVPPSNQDSHLPMQHTSSAVTLSSNTLPQFGEANESNGVAPTSPGHSTASAAFGGTSTGPDMNTGSIFSGPSAQYGSSTGFPAVCGSSQATFSNAPGSMRQYAASVWGSGTDTPNTSTGVQASGVGSRHTDSGNGAQWSTGSAPTCNGMALTYSLDAAVPLIVPSFTADGVQACSSDAMVVGGVLLGKGGNDQQQARGHAPAAATQLSVPAGGTAVGQTVVDGSAPAPAPPAYPLKIRTLQVLEFCDKGTLQDAIDRGWLRTSASQACGPEEAHVLATALDIATALAFLHSKSIVHGDLTAFNVLLKSFGKADHVKGFFSKGKASQFIKDSHGREFSAKIADFGKSRPLGAQDYIRTSSYGTITHMAPEVLRESRLGRPADMYAFGVLLWAMWTGSRPWGGMTHTQVVTVVAGNVHCLTFPDGTPEDVVALGRGCMAFDSSARLAAAQVVTQLQGMLASRSRDTRPLQV